MNGWRTVCVLLHVVCVISVPLGCRQPDYSTPSPTHLLAHWLTSSILTPSNSHLSSCSHTQHAHIWGGITNPLICLDSSFAKLLNVSYLDRWFWATKSIPQAVCVPLEKKISLACKTSHCHPFFSSVLCVYTQLYTRRQMAHMYFKSTSTTGAKPPKGGRNYRINDWCQGNKSEQGAWRFFTSAGAFVWAVPINRQRR